MTSTAIVLLMTIPGYLFIDDDDNDLDDLDEVDNDN
jgi:hypothetical protein